MQQHEIDLTNSTYAIFYGDDSGLHVIGTGFFISKNGLFVTAKHVLQNVKEWSGLILRQAKPYGGRTISNLSPCPFANDENSADIQLLSSKKEFERVNGKFIEPGFSEECEGTPILTFGYPLSHVQMVKPVSIYPETPFPDKLVVGMERLKPRLMQAVISSRYREVTGSTIQDESFYIIDKPLIYGTSGAPILSKRSGNAISIATGFDTFYLKPDAGLIPMTFDGKKYKLKPQIQTQIFGVSTRLSSIEDEILKWDKILGNLK